MGAKPPAAGNFLKKIAILNAILKRISHVFRAVSNNTIFKIRKYVEKNKLFTIQSSLYLESNSKHV